MPSRPWFSRSFKIGVLGLGASFLSSPAALADPNGIGLMQKLPCAPLFNQVVYGTGLFIKRGVSQLLVDDPFGVPLREWDAEVGEAFKSRIKTCVSQVDYPGGSSYLPMKADYLVQSILSSVNNAH